MKKLSLALLLGITFQNQAEAAQDYSLCRNVILEGNLILQDDGKLQPRSPFTFSYESKDRQDVYIYKNNSKDDLHKVIVEKNEKGEVTEINTYTGDGLTHLGSSKMIIVDGRCVPVQILSYKDKEIFTDFNLCRELDTVLKRLTPKQKGVAEECRQIDNSLAVVMNKYDRVANPYSNAPLFLLGVAEFPTVYGGMYLERCREVTDAGSYSRTVRKKLNETYALLEKAAVKANATTVAADSSSQR
jgi:hypothetical protein